MAHRKFVDLAINSMVIFQVAILHNQRVNWVIVPLCPHYVLNYVKNHCWWISIPWSSHETSIWSSRVAHLPCAVLWAIPFDPGGPWQGSSVWLSPQFFHRQEDFLSWGCLLEAQEMCGLWLEIVYIYICVCSHIYIYVYMCVWIMNDTLQSIPQQICLALFFQREIPPNFMTWTGLSPSDGLT